MFLCSIFIELFLNSIMWTTWFHRLRVRLKQKRTAENDSECELYRIRWSWSLMGYVMCDEQGKPNLNFKFK